jgi:nitroreductase
MHSLEQTINDRRSTRMFLPDKPVPRELVDQALVGALVAEATGKPPIIPHLPELFAHLWRDLGAKVYGSMGIARHDTEGRRIAVLRNWSACSCRPSCSR